MYSYLVKKGQDQSAVQGHSSPAKNVVTVINVDHEGNEQQDILLSTPAQTGHSARSRNSLTPICEDQCLYRDATDSRASGSTSPASCLHESLTRDRSEITGKRIARDSHSNVEDQDQAVEDDDLTPEAMKTLSEQQGGKDAKALGTRTKRRLPFPNTQDKLDELKAVVQYERAFATEKLFQLFDKEPLRAYLIPQVDCKDLRMSVCLSIEGSSAPLSELASHVLDMHIEGYETAVNVTAIRNLILSLADRVSHRIDVPLDTDVFEDTERLYWWRWELKDLKSFGISLKKKLVEFRKIRKKMAERYTSSEQLGRQIDKYHDFNSLASSDNLEGLTTLLSAFNNCVPLSSSFDKFEKWIGAQPGKDDSVPSIPLNQCNPREEKELQRLKLQAEKMKHREQRLAERKRVREQQNAEREEKKKKREEKKAKQEAEQAIRNKEAQKKADEKQKKAAETLRLEEQKSKEKQRQAQVMAKFLGHSENQCANGPDCSPITAEVYSDNSMNIDSKHGELKFIPLSPRSQTCIVSHFGKPITKSVDENLVVEWNESELFQENIRKWKSIGPSRVFNHRKRPGAQPCTRRQLVFAEGTVEGCNWISTGRRGRILLQFHENSRPAYYGTFSKRSRIISSRRPFSKDDKNIEDYDYDSGDDWDEPEDGESLKGSDEEIDEEEKEVEEEEDGFVVPDGYLSADEADYLDPVDKATAAETDDRSDDTGQGGEDNHPRPLAEARALLQFVSMAEKAKHSGKPIVITDESILQAFPVCILEDPAANSNESSEADDSQLGDDEILDDTKTNRQTREFPEKIHKEIIQRLNSGSVKSAAKFAGELISLCEDESITKTEVHKHVREVAEYSKSNSRWEVKSEYLKDLGLERQTVPKTPAKKSAPGRALPRGSVSIKSFFGKSSKEHSVPSQLVEDDKTSKTEESTSDAAAGSITGTEQEVETCKTLSIDQALLLSNPTPDCELQDIINRNLSHEDIFAFHQFDRDLIDSVIHKVNPAMAECLVESLGNQQLSLADRLRSVYAVANLTHCAREHLKQSSDQNDFLQILRVIYRNRSVPETLKQLKEENDVELVRGLFLLLNILLHDPLGEDVRLHPFQVDLAQALLSLDWCDTIVGGLSHEDEQIAARAACTSYHLLVLGSQESAFANGPTRRQVLREVSENLRKPLLSIRKYCLKCLDLLLSTENEFDKLGIFVDLQRHLQALQTTETRGDISLLTNEVAKKCSQQLRRFANESTRTHIENPALEHILDTRTA